MASSSIVEWQPGAVAEAIESCAGLRNLRHGDRVLIKPNIPLGGPILRSHPGIFTGVELVEPLVQLLRDHGAGDITIGEGTVVVPFFESSTLSAFFYGGYVGLSKRYDLTLRDFNKGPTVSREIAGEAVKVSAEVFEQDFVVNAPCLKTHIQTRTTLGMKNLKGCLKMEGKKAFHKRGLYRSIAELSRVITSDLVVIDGRRASEYGPISDQFKESNLVIAGTDVFEVDIIGTQILGVEPREVEYLLAFEERAGRSVASVAAETNVLTEKWRAPCRWRADDADDLESSYDITGLSFVRDRDGTTCSGCRALVLGAFEIFVKQRPRPHFGDAEIITGQGQSSGLERSSVILCGHCPIEANPELPRAIRVKGCPPQIPDILVALERALTLGANGDALP